MPYRTKWKPLHFEGSAKLKKSLKYYE